MQQRHVPDYITMTEVGAYSGETALECTCDRPDLDTPERLVVAQEVGEFILRCMDALPVAHANAFFLHALQGYTAEESAHLLGINAPLVRKHAERARAALKKMLYESEILFS